MINASLVKAFVLGINKQFEHNVYQRKNIAQRETNYTVVSEGKLHCRSGNIRVVLIYANFARRKNSRRISRKLLL